VRSGDDYGSDACGPPTVPFFFRKNKKTYIHACIHTYIRMYIFVCEKKVTIVNRLPLYNHKKEEKKGYQKVTKRLPLYISNFKNITNLL
jgi:hypothetical protein